MRNLNIYKILCISLLAFYACDDEQMLNLPEANHRVIVTSEANVENNINIGGHIDFGDISSGVASRTWTFPENVSSIFGSDKNTSGENTVKGFFNEVGVHNVTLHQVFKGDVYRNEDSSMPSGLKELDTTIVVTVLAAVKAQITGNYLNDDGSLGAPISISDAALNEVTASKKVRFSYTTIGAPEVFNWTFGTSGVDPTTFGGTNTEVDIQYKSLGNYDLKFIASRLRPFGGDTIFLKDLIKVIPSTEPVSLDAVKANEGKIDLEFSRDMDPDSFDVSTFVISLENGGTTIPTSIVSTEIKAGENNIITITLNEVIYNNDTVKVSYTPGTLRTTDQVNATVFKDKPLEFNLTNILKGSNFDYSFENSTDVNWPLAWGSAGIWNINTTQAQDGNSSAYVELPASADGFTWVQHVSNGAQKKVSFKAGKTYEIGAWVYLLDNGNSTGFAPDVRIYWKSTGDYDWNAPAVAILSDDMPTGTWVYQKAFINFGADGDYETIIRGWNNKNPNNVKFYIDNLTIAEVTIRP
ncbi:hypothetical protein M4I21_10740 [Cellulophaga sp. 20_2_10]|uniref:PKD domain-containing protein n=1 Tax=Polaribacter sejongensis TaxID=985043 RepID=A0ABN5FAF7_9FLAO|nr:MULTISPECIES: hypothetical protein [Flavobacteriaceae]AUC23906.1 hypothetical protein BTO15_18195 [Polaribacter sejongensis]MCL5246287.1 hypothetical protein [Cellulophaga sp. 20_2_10]